eukprot:229383-Prymnesium_polylepis.1
MPGQETIEIPPCLRCGTTLGACTGEHDPQSTTLGARLGARPSGLTGTPAHAYWSLSSSSTADESLDDGC